MNARTRSAGACRTVPRVVRLTATLLVGTVVLTGCGLAGNRVASVTRPSSGLSGTDIGDVIARPVLALPDTDGRTFDLRQRPADELTAVFFGYTNCPDVCPTTMADLAAARRQLGGADRDHVRVVFVTEDPKTDTPAVLRRWLDRFDSTFVGLVGGDPRTEQALDALKAPRTEIVPASPTAPASDAPTHVNGTGETVEHAGSVYVFKAGKVVVYTGGTTSAQYAADFHQLLRG